VILDAAGRAVRAVPATPDPAVFRWDGQDEAGRIVPSGTYFAVLHTDAGRSAQRFTWLRD
jgi:flagellar hook assembly protein FlgD